MTYERLKKLADKMGYKLIKKQEKVNLLPCKECGCKKRKQLYYSDKKEVSYVCLRCGVVATAGKNDVEARKNWNKEYGKAEE